MLTTEQIADLVNRRRLLLRDKMNSNIQQGRERSHDQVSAIAEYTSLEILLLAIQSGRMDVWDVAPPTAPFTPDMMRRMGYESDGESWNPK